MSAKSNIWDKKNSKKVREQKRLYRLRKRGGRDIRRPFSEATLLKMSETRKRLISEGKIASHPFKGKTGVYSKDILEANRKAHLGKVPWNKGKTNIYSKETLDKIRAWSRLTYEERFGKERADKIKMIKKEKRMHQIFPVKDTKIELKIQDFLKQLRIEYFTHQYIKEIKHGYQCDILIPSMKMIIECDGDYWHGNQDKFIKLNELQLRQREEDAIRTKELIEKGFRVIRLWENQINGMTIQDLKKIVLEVN